MVKYNAKPDVAVGNSYPAPGANGPAPLPAPCALVQAGVAEVVTQPGDPTFTRTTLAKQLPVKPHPATPSRELRGVHNPNGQDLIDQGTAAAERAGLDSGN